MGEGWLLQYRGIETANHHLVRQVYRPMLLQRLTTLDWASRTLLRPVGAIAPNVLPSRRDFPGAISLHAP